MPFWKRKGNGPTFGDLAETGMITLGELRELEQELALYKAFQSAEGNGVPEVREASLAAIDRLWPKYEAALVEWQQTHGIDTGYDKWGL